ncbi:MAG: formylglycine-generating enzyme family protein [Candidatus Cybelea sp.]
MRLAITFLAVILLCASASAQNLTPSPAPGAPFQDCADCPAMVVVAAGSFVMGSSAAQKAWAAAHGGNLASVADEAPQHTVVIHSFALGAYDVTRDEYSAFIRSSRYQEANGCGRDSFKWSEQVDLSWQHPGFSQSGSDPAVCVSWQDAQAYIAWLNKKIAGTSGGGKYRLPTEAEWEYAARAGSTTLFWWGDDGGVASDHAWYKENSGGRTQPVGMKGANAFGLYDIVGNVWQWTQDCYGASYANAPADGRAVETTANCLRVDRGGSWLYPAWLLRSSTRERNPAQFRDRIMGFRVARYL